MKSQDYSGIYRAEIYEGGKAVRYLNFNGRFPSSIEEALSKRGIECAKVELVEKGVTVGVLAGKVVGMDVWEEAMKPKPVRKPKVIKVSPADFAPEPETKAAAEPAETADEKVEEAPKQRKTIHATMGHNVSARGKGKAKTATPKKDDEA